MSQHAAVRRLGQVCDRWSYPTCLCFALDVAVQQRSGFGYSYSIYQVAYGRNLLFRSGSQLQQLLDRVVDRTRSRPVQLTSRWRVKPTRFAGVAVPPYGQILLLLGAGNRDPPEFAEPARFDPDRASGPPLSFGGGAYSCLGAPLARLEAQIAFGLVLRRFPQLALAGEPVWRDRLTLRGYASLPVAPALDLGRS